MSDRRVFLKSTALLGACGLLSSAALAAPAVPFKFGQCSYWFKNYTPEQLIAALHELGLHDLNIKPDFHLPMEPASTVAERADRYRAAGINLTACGTINMFEDSDAAVRPVFECLKAARINLFVGSPSHASLDRVAACCKQYNVRMAIHNHGPEDKYWPSPFDVEKRIGSLDPTRIGYCIDLAHTLRAGRDPAEAVRMAGKRLFDCHIKDFADLKDVNSQVPVGQGKLPVKQIFEALLEIKYPGFVDLEYDGKDDPLPGIRQSRAYMEGVLRQLGYSA